MNAAHLTVQQDVVAARRRDVLVSAFVALFLGFGLVYLTGFATTVEAHNAAHDARHAQGFPCH